MGMINRESVIAALKNGFSNTQIAGALGVTDSAIHQFVEEHGLQAIAAQNSKFQAIDDKLNVLEEATLDKLGKMLQMAVLDPVRLAAIYKVLNGAKRRSLAEGHSIQNINNVRLVNLNLPKHVEVKIGLNHRNEVIEVEGRTLNTLPAGKLVEMTQVKTKGTLSNDQSKIVDIL